MFDDTGGIALLTESINKVAADDTTLRRYSIKLPVSTCTAPESLSFIVLPKVNVVIRNQTIWSSLCSFPLS